MVTPTEVVRIAAVQMISGTDVQRNLDAARKLIAQAVGDGARLIVLPEYFCLMGRRDTDKVDIREAPGRGPIQDFLSGQARLHQVWIVGGTLPLSCSNPQKVFNTLIVFGPDGGQLARYDKIHLFAFQRGAEAYDESRSICAGAQVVVVDLPLAEGGRNVRVGLAVCYDLRFPEMFRSMGPLDLLVVPAAFTATTGIAHWETLLRARAIENLCYVLASAQGGRHENGRETYGHSMVIDPWGAVINCLESGEGVVCADWQASEILRCREQLPALSHRVLS